MFCNCFEYLSKWSISTCLTSWLLKRWKHKLKSCRPIQKPYSIWLYTQYWESIYYPMHFETFSCLLEMLSLKQFKKTEPKFILMPLLLYYTNLPFLLRITKIKICICNLMESFWHFLLFYCLESCSKEV